MCRHSQNCAKLSQEACNRQVAAGSRKIPDPDFWHYRTRTEVNFLIFAPAGFGAVVALLLLLL